jgi:ABC-2 type transport system permease protein
MSVTTPTGSQAPSAPVASDGAGLLAATVALGRRSVLATARQPAAWVPGVLFPLLIAAVNAASLNRTIDLPGFPPVDSFLQFLLPATVIQGVLFGGIVGGADVALDIQNGFFDRLLSSPVARPAILLGRLGGAVVLGAVQAVFFLTVFVIFGATIEGGLAAVAVIVVVAMILALAVGGFAAAVGLRTGSQEAVQNFFPLVFVMLFISSAFFPTTLMNGWFRWVAERNPLTWLINSVRDLVIYGFDASDALRAVGIAAVLATITVAMAAGQLRRRVRTS